MVKTKITLNLSQKKIMRLSFAKLFLLNKDYAFKIGVKIGTGKQTLGSDGLYYYSYYLKLFFHQINLKPQICI